MWNIIGRVRQRKLKNDSSKRSHLQQDTVFQSSDRNAQQTRAATSSCNIKKDKCNIEQLSSNDLLNETVCTDVAVCSSGSVEAKVDFINVGGISYAFFPSANLWLMMGEIRKRKNARSKTNWNFVYMDIDMKQWNRSINIVKLEHSVTLLCHISRCVDRVGLLLLSRW